MRCYLICCELTYIEYSAIGKKLYSAYPWFCIMKRLDIDVSTEETMGWWHRPYLYNRYLCYRRCTLPSFI